MSGKALVESLTDLGLSPVFPVKVMTKEVKSRSETSLHKHYWSQLVFSDRGATQVTTSSMTYWVPPHHAVWIPPDHIHSASLLERASLFSVYFLKHNPLFGSFDWHRCQCFEVSCLLGELIKKMSATNPETMPEEIYNALCKLIYTEIAQSRPIPIGVPMPKDRRLRHLCQLFLNSPQQYVTLHDLAAVVGASESTIGRLFRNELNMTFSQWRQQALLASAITLAAKKMSIGRIALELGYSSHSAFTAMVTSIVGKSPKHFLNQ